MSVREIGEIGAKLVKLVSGIVIMKNDQYV